MKKTSYCWMTKRLSPVALEGLYILKSPLFRDFYIVNILGHLLLRIGVRRTLCLPNVYLMCT